MSYASILCNNCLNNSLCDTQINEHSYWYSRSTIDPWKAWNSWFSPGSITAISSWFSTRPRWPRVALIRDYQWPRIEESKTHNKNGILKTKERYLWHLNYVTLEGLFIPVISFNKCNYLLNVGVFYHIAVALWFDQTLLHFVPINVSKPNIVDINKIILTGTPSAPSNPGTPCIPYRKTQRYYHFTVSCEVSLFNSLALRTALEYVLKYNDAKMS